MILEYYSRHAHVIFIDIPATPIIIYHHACIGLDQCHCFYPFDRLYDQGQIHQCIVRRLEDKLILFWYDISTSGFWVMYKQQRRQFDNGCSVHGSSHEPTITHTVVGIDSVQGSSPEPSIIHTVV